MLVEGVFVFGIINMMLVSCISLCIDIDNNVFDFFFGVPLLWNLVVGMLVCMSIFLTPDEFEMIL